MEVRYQIKHEGEQIVKEVDFVNFYPANDTIFVRYGKEKKPGELLIGVHTLTYFKVYRD